MWRRAGRVEKYQFWLDYSASIFGTHRLWKMETAGSFENVCNFSTKLHDVTSQDSLIINVHFHENLVLRD